MVCEMRGKWLNYCCFVRCCSQELFKTVSSSTDTAKCLAEEIW